MNQLTRTILKGLTNDDDLWEWEKLKGSRKKIPIRGKPKVGEFQTRYYMVWADMMWENVIYHMLRRAYDLFDMVCRGRFGAEIKSDNFLHYHFIYENVVDENGKPETLMEINCAGCLYDIQLRFTEPRYWEWYRGKHKGRTLCYFDRWLLRHEDCQQEEITEDMILEVFSPAQGEQIQMF